MKLTKIFGLGIVTVLALAACGGDDNKETTSSSNPSGSGGSGAGGSGNGGSGGEGGASAASVDVQTYTSDATFVVNSHLIVGSTEAILVDGQFFKADADKVVKLVQDSKKTLTTVFLTHAHPDHYLGMDVIKTAFPNAKFVTTKAVLDDYNAKKDATLQAVQMYFPGQIADKVVDFADVGAASLTVDGVKVNIVEFPLDGEAVEAAGLEVSLAGGKKGFISGDLVYNQAYLWLAECHIDGFASNLDTVAKGMYDTIFPGHGGAKATPTALTEDKDYITKVVPILKAAATADEAIKQIQAAYPTWGGTGLLQNGTQNLYQAKMAGMCDLP